MRVATDIGGTFTDVVTLDRKGIQGWKVLSTPERPDSAVTDTIRTLSGISSFSHGTTVATNALLELDEALWRAQEDLENEEFISQAREILREMIVLLGLKLESRSDRDSRDLLKSLVETLVEAREKFRRSKRWKEADEIREKLHQGGIVVQDTPSGPTWKPPH